MDAFKHFKFSLQSFCEGPLISELAFFHKTISYFVADWLKSHKKVKVQVGKDQEKAQSEKDSHSKNRGGKNQTKPASMGMRPPSY